MPSNGDSKRLGGAALRASYSALCALADESSGATTQQQEHFHPALASFENEQELLAYITALRARISAALTLSTNNVRLAQVHPKQMMPLSDSTMSKPSLPSSTSATAAPCPSSSQRVPTPVATPSETPIAASSSRSSTVTHTGALLPEHEREFQAVARWLLAAPDRLRAYHVVSDDDEVLDPSFSQIDCRKALNN